MTTSRSDREALEAYERADDGVKAIVETGLDALVAEMRAAGLVPAYDDRSAALIAAMYRYVVADGRQPIR